MLMVKPKHRKRVGVDLRAPPACFVPVSRCSALTLLSCSRPLPEAANGFAYRRRWAAAARGRGRG